MSFFFVLLNLVFVLGKDVFPPFFEKEDGGCDVKKSWRLFCSKKREWNEPIELT